MSIAELHGKLSPNNPRGVHERMEDLLTSDVFGTMLYAGWQPAFHKWLADAQRAPCVSSSVCFEDFLPIGAELRIAYSFWPALENGREPDVALWIEGGNDFRSLILVEAKYLSGLSGETQLIEEAEGLFRLNEGKVRQWRFSPPVVVTAWPPRKALLYITADSSMPVSELTPGSSGSWPTAVFWLSWKSLCQRLAANPGQSTDSARHLLSDLKRLLDRKGLRAFDGFDQEPLGELSAAGFYAGVRTEGRARRR